MIFFILNYILITLVDFYVFITFFLLPGSKSTFPEENPDPDPAQWYGSGVKKTLIERIERINE